MSTDSQQAASSSPPAGFWKIRHAVIGLGVLAILVTLMMRACGDDEPAQRADSQADTPRQAIVVQIPASQWPAQQAPQQPVAPPQPGYGYAPAPPVQQAPAPPPADSSNPWAVQTQPRSYGQYRTRQWGQPQQKKPQPQQYAEPSSGARYRPLATESSPRTHQAPVVVQTPVVPGYRPVAPYDRLSGSSFGPPGYHPYGSPYPGYYGPGTYAVPGGAYAPAWPGAAGPGIGWPGYW